MGSKTNISVVNMIMGRLFNAVNRRYVYASIMVLITIIVGFIAYGSKVIANELNLPDLGSAGSGVITPSQEYSLGQQWLRLFRAQAPITRDPYLQEYTEELTRSLSRYSALQDLRLDVLVVNNKSLNAFAVPGGVIGVHTGLFTHARTKEQFCSVMSHEIAHLSQRHYARRVEQQKENAIPMMAALVASIVLAASGGGDAGIAAIAATQSASLDAQLSFSRQMEREADRLGMNTLIKANMNPYAMSEMFENMQESTRYRRKPPPFLLSHPITQNRISDAKLRAQKYPQQSSSKDLEYQLMRTRVDILHSSNIETTEKIYAERVASTSEPTQKNNISNIIPLYGLIVAQIELEQYSQAKSNIQKLLALTNILDAKILQAQVNALLSQNNSNKWTKEFEKLMEFYSNSHPLNMIYAETLMKKSQYKRAISLLEKHSQTRPKDSYIWYLLAESYGLVGDILNVHKARAEYFLLHANFLKAATQLNHAMQKTKNDPFKQASIKQKVKELRRLEKSMER